MLRNTTTFHHMSQMFPIPFLCVQHIGHDDGPHSGADAARPGARPSPSPAAGGARPTADDGDDDDNDNDDLRPQCVESVDVVVVAAVAIDDAAASPFVDVGGGRRPCAEHAQQSAPSSRLDGGHIGATASVWRRRRCGRRCRHQQHIDVCRCGRSGRDLNAAPPS